MTYEMVYVRGCCVDIVDIPLNYRVRRSLRINRICDSCGGQGSLGANDGYYRLLGSLNLGGPSLGSLSLGGRGWVSSCNQGVDCWQGTLGGG